MADYLFISVAFRLSSHCCSSFEMIWIMKHMKSQFSVSQFSHSLRLISGAKNGYSLTGVQTIIKAHTLFWLTSFPLDFRHFRPLWLFFQTKRSKWKWFDVIGLSCKTANWANAKSKWSIRCNTSSMLPSWLGNVYYFLFHFDSLRYFTRSVHTEHTHRIDHHLCYAWNEWIMHGLYFFSSPLRSVLAKYQR